MTRRCVLYAMVLCFGCSEPQDLDDLDELLDGGADGGAQESSQGAISGSAVDGAVDSGLDGSLVAAPCTGAAGLGEVCTVGKGACERAGAYVCTAGTLVCNVEPGMPATELCGTDRDEDCDGTVDETPEDGCCGHEDCAQLEVCERPEGDAFAAGECKSFERPNADCTRTGDEVSCTCREGYDDDGSSCVRNACIPLEQEAQPCAAHQSCNPTNPGEKTCTCEAGFDNCDDRADNGCEQPLDAVQHCGACGVACDARASCLTGTAPRCACNRPLIGDGSSCNGYGPIAAGTEVTCGIRATGAIECFPSAPTTPSGSYKQLALSGPHSCAVSASGSVACWGTNSNGALTVPATPPNSDYAQVVVGNEHSCALKNDGTPVCWGVSQTNPGSSSDHGQSKPPKDTFQQLAAGGYHTCGLRADGSVRCWGAGTTRDDATCSTLYACGQAMPPDERFVQISAGLYHSCGLRSDGKVLCWGAGGADLGQDPIHQGQLLAPDNTLFTFISAGAFHTCGVRTDKKVSCWGAGSQAGSQLPADFQQSVPPAGDFLRVSAGVFHTCGLTTVNQLRCWGGLDPAKLPQTSTSGTWPLNP